MTNADYLAKFLARKEITHVYELIGGMITFLLDAIHREGKTEIVSMHHEQGAGFAAEGWARMTGKPGVALATSGPGATNLITAIGSCYFDSTAAIFITGQVNRHEQKGELAVRQLGFQETNIVDAVKPITKAAWLVNDPDELPIILEKAYAIAMSGRPGPVLVDIPMDVQRHILPDNAIENPAFAAIDEKIVAEDVEGFFGDLIQAIKNAKSPLILAGGGLRTGNAIEGFRQFASQTSIPVVHSLMGVDVLSYSDPLRVGMIGSYGNRWANLALSESDLILVFGSRMDIRQTGSDVGGFSRDRRFFHVDCEKGELNNRVKGCRTLECELKSFFSFAATALPEADLGIDFSQWHARIANLRNQWPDINELESCNGINPNVVMHLASGGMDFIKAYVTDVGQHQMWAAQSLELTSDQRFLTSGGMGSMGFGLPAAIGAAIASGPTLLIAGDGGFQCNIQELQTIKRNNLPVKMIVLNNGCHGMVRQFQESYFNSRYQSTLWGYDTPSFKLIAEAYGIKASYVNKLNDLGNAISDLYADLNAPFLLEIAIDTGTNAYPKLAFGRPFGEMEPLAKPLEMEGT